MLIDKLKSENSKLWDAYIKHEFVKQIESGDLPMQNFLFYLKQDYIYLINYTKCYARLAINATNAKELRFAVKFINAIISGEIELHKSILSLGIDTDKIALKDESLCNLAYTRYMLSVGESGDYLDMLVALSACAIGYTQIALNMLSRLKTIPQNHPYKEWIQTYASKEMQDESKEFCDFVNSYTDKIDEAKFKRLSEIFANVTRLEIAFWQHGLDMKL
ncbi:MAG: thiaminase II [Campylobacter sp.]|nr:thiaminase II [Campylobacter sp.]